ncbi:hypothetical protein LguiB_007498 [Lonicera macranthoides]
MSLSAISLRRSSPVVRFQARFHGGSDKPSDGGSDKPRDDTAGNAVQKQGKEEKRMTRNRAILNFIKEMKIDVVIGDDIPPGVHKLQFHTKEEFDKLTTILSSKDLPQKFGLEDPKARLHEILLDYATKMAIVDGSGEILSNLSKFLSERYFVKKATTVSVSDILSQLNEALKIINEKVEPEKGPGSGKEEKKEGSAKEEKKDEGSAKEEKKEEGSANEEKKEGSE